jgi:hypothetical protein
MGSSCSDYQFETSGHDRLNHSCEPFKHNPLTVLVFTQVMKALNKAGCINKDWALAS